MSSTVAAQSQNRTQRRVSRRDTRRGAQRAGRPLSPVEMVVLLAIAALLIAGVLHDRARTPDVSASHTVQVSAGDTLWSIAKANPVAGLSTAQTAERIARANGLNSAALASGQTIRVPAEGALDTQLASR
jgi:nucleoid-associated protein YgaU